MSTHSMTPSDIGIHPPGFRLPARSHVGMVRLAVSNLERSVQFYSQIIGLRVLGSNAKLARLAPQESQTTLLELEELPGIQPIAPGSRLGLYHTAFLLPDREHLARFLQHLNHNHVAFGAGDHIYSEAFYLTDPDGLTVEVYADRDRSSWQVEGRELISATNPVHLHELAALSSDPWAGMPNGTMIGHVHLYVGNLKQAAAFYHQALGLDLMTWRYPGALFLSAGGYHHHVAVNTWATGAPIASERDARLLFWELVLPSSEDRLQLVNSLHAADFQQESVTNGRMTFTDPWGIRIALISGTLEA